MAKKIVCGYVLTLTGANGATALMGQADSAIAFDDQGKILAVGPKTQIQKQFPAADCQDYGDKVILPGFIDLHSHPPQLDIIGSFGDQLLPWLEQHTYPKEIEFAQPAVAKKTAARYLRWNLQAGITCGVWFSTSNLAATLTLCEQAATAGVRAIIGKTSMDQHGPKELLVEVSQEKDQWSKLLEAKQAGTWPKVELAVTPRFAPACSKELLTFLGDLLKREPALYGQTHVSENKGEIALAAKVHPGHTSYTATYDDYGLLTGKTILAHGIHLTEAETDLLQRRNAAIAHCPTSNLFLGSGLYPLAKHSAQGLEKVGLATDIGAGTTLCFWETMRAAYGIAHLQDQVLAPEELLALATVGAATALGKENFLGQLREGFVADWQVINWRDGGVLENQIDQAQSSEDVLKALLALGSYRLTDAVYVAGERVWQAE